MVAKRTVLVAVAGAGVLAGLGWWLLAGPPQPPVVDPALAQAVRPVIDEHLARGPWSGALAGMQSRWFCDQRIIEIRQDSAETKVGLRSRCEEFARSGGTLLRGSGESAAKLAVLTGGPDRYVVHRIETPPDGRGNAEWIKRTFSPGGVAELHRMTTEPGPDQVAPARQAFGLPPDAPVRNGP